MNTNVIDYVTHTEFQNEVKSIRGDIKDLMQHIDTSELRLAKQLSEKIYDTYLKMIPIILTILGLQLGAVFVVVKSMVD
jgi:endonuclease IV